MLRCNDNTLYTGWTNNIENRIKKHNSGNGAKYTRLRIPVELVYFEKYSTNNEAMRRECAIKKLNKSKKENLILNFERSKKMKKIESFSVNHLDLFPGVYVSRRDEIENNIITTFDIRITKPNVEPVMSTAAIHAIEHIGATFLRNNESIKNEVIYFGPMGCRTGFYLILKRNLESKTIIDILKETFDYIVNFQGDIPGASAKECGNYNDMNLSMAKYYSKRYLEDVLNNIKKKQMKYPK
jgi:S-ribosylhomocysteine lyase